MLCAGKTLVHLLEFMRMKILSIYLSRPFGLPAESDQNLKYNWYKSESQNCGETAFCAIK